MAERIGERLHRWCAIKRETHSRRLETMRRQREKREAGRGGKRGRGKERRKKERSRRGFFTRRWILADSIRMLVARFSRDIEIRRKGQRRYVRAIQTVSLWPPPPARLRGAALPQYANDPCYEHDRVASSRKLVNWLAGMRICRDCSGHLLPLHFARRYRIDQFVHRPMRTPCTWPIRSNRSSPPPFSSFQQKFGKYPNSSPSIFQSYLSFPEKGSISVKFLIFFQERERERDAIEKSAKKLYIYGDL